MQHIDAIPWLIIFSLRVVYCMYSSQSVEALNLGALYLNSNILSSWPDCLSLYPGRQMLMDFCKRIFTCYIFRSNKQKSISVQMQAAQSQT